MEILKDFPFHLQCYVLEFSEFKFRRQCELYRKVLIPPQIKALTFKVNTLYERTETLTFWTIGLGGDHHSATQMLTHYRRFSQRSDYDLYIKKVRRDWGFFHPHDIISVSPY